MESSLEKRIRIVSTFIVADSNTIIDRLLRRTTENFEKILMRIKTLMDECLQIPSYEFVLANCDINRSVVTLEELISDSIFQPMDFDVYKYIEWMKKIRWLLDD